MKIASKTEPPTYWQLKKGDLLKRKYGYGQFEGNVNLATAIALALGMFCLLLMTSK